jgi:Ca2+-transporting ATPase
MGVAYRTLDELPADPANSDTEASLTIVGLVGIIDPPRPEVGSAIATARGAGVRTIMITGDHQDTAVAIAEAIDLAPPGADAITGSQLSEMSDEELAGRVGQVDIYARVSPEHKVAIVEALKAKGDIVAMTGDGVNDAPALKRSHIGVAMGITGTDVSRETADMVLTDDNYASIVAAIEEGRTIYDNIRKFVFYLISCNIGEILIIFIAMLAGLAAETGQAPLLPIHLLWLNLVTDGLPALALGLEPAEPGIMRRPPRDPAEQVLSRDLWPLIAVQSAVIPLATLSAFVWAYSGPDSMRYAQTVTFATLVTAELLRAYTSRSQEQTIFEMGFASNRYMVLATASSFLLLLVVIYVPALSRLFQTVPLTSQDWIPIALLATLPAVAAEVTKSVRWQRRAPVAG